LATQTHESAPLSSRLAALSAAMLAAIPAAACCADLGSDIDGLVRGSGLPRSAVSVAVVEVATGRLVASSDATRPMAPASNMKVLTTGAALEAFGPDFHFRTRLARSETPAGVRLTIVGDGDPAFGDPEVLAASSLTDASGQVRASVNADLLLDHWVDAVARSGDARIAELVVDARIFDSQAYHPRWPQDQFGEDYCAEVWGLNYHLNTVHVMPAPSRGGPAVVEWMSPRYDWIITKNTSSSSAGGKSKGASSFWISRNPGSNELVLGGRSTKRPGQPLDLTVTQTPSLAGELLARRLRDRGIEVGAARSAQAGDAAPSDRTVGPVIQTPMSIALNRANTDSSNLYAESLLKRLGAFRANSGSTTPSPTFVAGSWSNGAEALARSVQARLGDAAPSGWVFSDGSGLSRDNRVSAEGLARWIRSFAVDPRLRAVYFDSFAVAGRSGTVKNRFKELAGLDVTVQCKTGYIRGVSCLTGLVTGPDGTAYAFSVLGNNLEAGSRVAQAKTLQERIVGRVAEEAGASRRKRT